MKTDLHLLKNEKCCGCGVCSAVCPQNIIEMKPDNYGFLYPQIVSPNFCVACHLCMDYCPSQHLEEIQIPTHNVAVFAGFTSNPYELQKSASGGIASSISQQIIKEGGVVYGVVYSSDFSKAMYRKADTSEALEAFRGSKYIQADKLNIYSDVLEALKCGKKVLFIGLPCDVAGLKTYLGKDFPSLFTIELICYGVTSPKVAEYYLSYLENKFHKKVVDFSVRYKKGGKWTPPYLYAMFEDGFSYLHPFYDTDYGIAFSLLSRPSCYNCVYKGNKRVADMTIGDYWGCTEEDAFWNSGGVSSVFVHTEKGNILVECLSGVKLFGTDYAHASAANPMIENSLPSSPLRNIFSRLFVIFGLKTACFPVKIMKKLL